MIDPNNSSAQRFHNAERFVDVASPDGSRQPIRGIVGDSNGVGLAFEWNHRGNWAKDFFARNSCTIIHVVKNCRLDVKALAELFWPPAADGRLGFLFSYFKIGTDAIVLLLADQRPHLRLPIHWRTELNALCFFRHCFDKFRVNLFFHQDAAAGRADFSLVDEHSKQRPIHGRFPISVGKKYVWRFSTKFKRHTLQSVRRAFDNGFSDRGTSGERNLVHTGMRDQRRASGLAKPVHNIDHSRR